MIALLLILNLALQLFDGLATYYGLSHGVQESNPILRSCFDFYGVGVTLIGAKSAACLFLWFLYRVAYLAVSQWGLVITALSYFLCSFVPWVLVWMAGHTNT